MAELDDYFDGVDHGRDDAMEGRPFKLDSDDPTYFAGYEDGYYKMKPLVEVVTNHGYNAGHICQVMMAAHVAYRNAEVPVKLCGMMTAVVSGLEAGREIIEPGTPLYDAIERMVADLLEVEG